MTWNSHQIWRGFGPNCCRFVKWNGMEFPWESTSHFLQGIQVWFVFHARTWHRFLTRSSHGISMAFVKKMMGFPSHLISFWTKRPSKRHEEIRVIYFTGFFSPDNFSPDISQWNEMDFSCICPSGTHWLSLLHPRNVFVCPRPLSCPFSGL